MTEDNQPPTPRPRRSALFVPASNERALAKAALLSPDVLIFDLEDAVAPAEKAAARSRLESTFSATSHVASEHVIRVNSLASEWGAEDIAAAVALRPDAILIPKVEVAEDVIEVARLLDPAAPTKLWAMIETPKGVLNSGPIAALAGDRQVALACLVTGTNDLGKETGVTGRRYLMPWLMQIVLAARACGLDVLDGVSNDFRDLAAFSAECAEGAAMGFDGKTLIHPAQIEPANAAFTPSPAAVEEAQRIIAAFERPENAARGVISLDGRMVERLHLAQARRLLAKSARTAEH